MTVHRDKFLANKTNRRTEFQFYWYYDSTCFGQPFCPSSVLRRTSALVHLCSLMTVATSCDDCLLQAAGWNSVPFWSCSKAVYKLQWHIPLLSVQWINSWWWTDELSEISRFSWQNKFVKLVHLQDGARNVIPLIVHITHFYYYKSFWHLVQN